MSRKQREAFVGGYNRCACDKELGGLTVAEVNKIAEAIFPDPPAKCVREIVVEYLEDNGYEGLYCEDCCCWPDPDDENDPDFMRKYDLECGSGCLPGVLVGGKIVRREG